MKTKKIVVSCLTILALMVSVLAGAVFAAPMQQKQNTSGNVGYVPDSGIRWNPGTEYFEVFNYAGFTQIGGGNFVNASGEVTTTGTDSAVQRRAEVSSKYTLMQDIAYAESDVSIARTTQAFKGELDGRGMNLIGFPMQNVSGEYYGLFHTNEGTLRSINFINPTFGTLVKGNTVGMLVHTNSGTLIDCTTRGKFESTETAGIYVGGLVYSALGGTRIESSKNEMSITAQRVGGIVGSLFSNTDVTLLNCDNVGALRGDLVAGLVGGLSAYGLNAYNCSSLGKLSGPLSYNFSYKNGGNLQDCYGIDNSIPAGLSYVIRYHLNGFVFTDMTDLKKVGDAWLENVWTGKTTTLVDPVANPAVGEFNGWYTTSTYTEESKVTTVDSSHSKNGFVDVYARVKLDESNNLIYTDMGAYYQVSPVQRYKGEIVIPETYKDKPVTTWKNVPNSQMTKITIPQSITSGTVEHCYRLTEVVIEEGGSLRKSMFAYTADLKKVTLPKTGITTLPSSLFYNSGIEEITIPDTVTTISDSAFSNTKLKAITIPAAVKSIDGTAFLGSANLEKITVDPNNQSYKVLENTSLVAIADPTTLLLAVFPSNFTIPKGITTVANYAMTGYSLAELIIPEGVTTMGTGALNKASGLQHLSLPKSLTKMCGLSECSSLATITVAAGNPAYREEGNCLIDIASNIVVGAATTNVEIPTSVTGLGVSLFAYLQVETLVIPANIKSINSTFQFSKIKYITIPATVTELRGSVFWGAALQRITFEEGSTITELPTNMFRGATSLREVELSSSIKTIGDNAFDGCTSLESFFIPKTVTKMGSDIFIRSGGLLIYAEAESQPAGWDSRWNSYNSSVVWGATKPATQAAA